LDIGVDDIEEIKREQEEINDAKGNLVKQEAYFLGRTLILG